MVMLLLMTLLLMTVLMAGVTLGRVDAMDTAAPAHPRPVMPSSDFVVAGGLDGRVYALDAWSGQVLWSFDSGGPMVNLTQCLDVEHHSDTASNVKPTTYQSMAARPREATRGDVDVNGNVHVTRARAESREEVEGRAVMPQQHTEAAQGLATSAAFMSQLVPSYDGRLYHVSKGKVQELGMTMADIVNVNGPVRLSVEATVTDDEPAVDVPAADILIFGEKTLDLFTLNAVSGFRRAHLSSPASTAMSTDVLFGRSEFTTRAVHSRNASAARCFRVSEFFLDFTQRAHCPAGDDDHTMVPEILVVPKNYDAALEGTSSSAIVAFDPWTKKQLWEFEIPDFDVLAVYGVSTMWGATFYNWKVDGPSSSRRVRTPARVTAKDWHRRRHSIAVDQPKSTMEQKQKVPDSLMNQQLVRVLPRTWDAMTSRFRLRMMGNDYFFQASESDGVATSRGIGSPTFHRQRMGDEYNYHEEIEPPGSRRLLWEPIVNGGKQGVFITYTHAVVMLLGVATCGILLAWGCYFKGLSASLAQSAIKTLDQSQFFTSHVHRLVIHRRGEADISISSMISRSLVMNALGVNDRVPLLESGNAARSRVSDSSGVATEAALMERFSRLAANESAAILLDGRHVNGTQKLLTDDLFVDCSASTDAPACSASILTNSSIGDITMPSLAGQVYRQRLTSTVSVISLSYAEEDSVLKEDEDEVGICKRLPSADEDVAFLAIDRVRSDECFKSTNLKNGLLFADDDSGIFANSPRSVSSSGKLTTGSCSGNSDSNSSHQSNDGDDVRTTPGGEGGLDEKTSDGKSSTYGSLQSSSSEPEIPSDEAEVFFPFVCQSRFVNEFEELSAIGKGGFGQVTLAENRLDGRKYAIKRVGLNLKNQTSKTLQKFLREVKILALLDHTNIVRYYQAWLEKVEESTEGTLAVSSVASDTSSVGGHAAAANYSTNNLLAPISEFEFSGDRRQLEGVYSNRSAMSDNADDGGFVWERGVSGIEDDDGWKEEDLIVQNKPHTSNVPPRASPSCSPAACGSGEDSSLNAVETCDHWLYIQMQYCAGRNLADYLAVPGRPMELSRMLKIFVQIASALAHVHSCGLIHRDLKPANIFVADVERDEIKLGDFGLSRYAANVSSLNAAPSLDNSQQGHPSHGLRDTALSASMWSNTSESNEVTAGVGTYLYASPEQVAGKKYSAKTDIYSLGMILFELCHERFGTTMERYITLRDARDSKFPADLRAAKRCPEIIDMLSKLLSHDPSARPTADAVVQWGQMMYETSLAQKTMDVVRSPRNLDMIRAATGAYPFVLGDDHVMASVSKTVVPTTFSLNVEAATGHCDGENGGDRRVPNHNLLKQVCDVIAGVHNGKVEIKKCGLHMENEGVTILAFELDPQGALADAPDSDVEGSVVMAIEALAGVQTVHCVSKID